jgi:hypothetical protein
VLVGTPPPLADREPSEAGPRAAPNLFTGMPPLLMLGLGVVMGAAISFAVGVVIWSVFG